MGRGNTTTGVAALCLVAAVTGGLVQAQQSGSNAPVYQGLDEVVVTARKRDESILKVPVVEIAIPQAKLEQLQITDFSDLPKLVPGLNLGGNILTIGTMVSIRGVGTVSYDQGVDSSVSLNIDGLSLGNGLAFQSGLFDLQRIEVLKGPQALFYGKSSPAGVISLRTADPTDRFEVIGRAEYEAESIEPLGQLILSGPLTDTLKVRLAGQYSGSEGYFRNEAVPDTATGAIAPLHSRAPDSVDSIVRGTVLWDPLSQVSARLKVNAVHDRANDSNPLQLTDCPDGTAGPLGIAFLGGGEDCRLDRTFRSVAMNPAIYPGILNGGHPFIDTNQLYGTLELNYRPRQDLTLTSTTGYYHLSSQALVNALATTFAAPPVTGENHYHRHDVTEEVRLNTDFAWPVNFTIGGLYEEGGFAQELTVIGNSTYGLPAQLADGRDTVDISTRSLFGQGRWKILQPLELAAGVRWTNETRSQVPLDLLTDTVTTGVTPRLHADNLAPEVTLTYTPTDTLTLFGAWKQGFKSGSFAVANPPTPGQNNAFGDEKVHGGEVGLKTRLLDHQLALNVAGYLYDYNGLQVGAIGPPVNGLAYTTTLNAGAARTYGVDFDGSYRPMSIQGLGVNGAVNINRARYLLLDNIPCWGGQTIAAGCNQILSAATGLFQAQQLSGTPMVRAPTWQANFGFDYTLPVGRDYQLVFTNSNSYSSKFVTNLAANRPNHDNYQSSFVKSDIGVSLQAPDGLWEFAVIAKNVADKITAGNCATSNAANGVIFGGQVTGGTGVGPAGVDEAECWGDVGREVWLRLTIRPLASRQ
jgi:iron complex outermembrane receptor protein